MKCPPSPTPLKMGFMLLGSSASFPVSAFWPSCRHFESLFPHGFPSIATLKMAQSDDLAIVPSRLLIRLLQSLESNQPCPLLALQLQLIMWHTIAIWPPEAELSCGRGFLPRGLLSSVVSHALFLALNVISFAYVAYTFHSFLGLLRRPILQKNTILCMGSVCPGLYSRGQCCGVGSLFCTGSGDHTPGLQDKSLLHRASFQHILTFNFQGNSLVVTHKQRNNN